MARQSAGNQQNPFRRPVSLIICVLSFFAALYIYVFFSYFHTAVNHPPPSHHHHDIEDSGILQQQTRTREPNSLEIQQKNSQVASRIIKSNQSDLEGFNDFVTAVVECQTSHGNLVIDVREKWAPLGAQRYLELVELGLFTDLPFFRVCPRYITQFGVRYGWKGGLQSLSDDPSLWGKRDMNFGYLFFAVIDLIEISQRFIVSPLCREVVQTLAILRW
jgi:hypothetical protein